MFTVKEATFAVCVVIATISSCKNAKKVPTVPAFKGIQLYGTNQQFLACVDSLVTYDPKFRKVHGKEYYYTQFTEETESGLTYYGYLVPSFTNKRLTQLKIFFSPRSDVASVEAYSNTDEQPLLYWGNKGNIVYNDINLKLQIKYGPRVKNSKATSYHKHANYEFIYGGWEADDLEILLLQEVAHDDGLNNFDFCNYFVIYNVSDNFKKENQAAFDKMMKDDIVY